MIVIGVDGSRGAKEALRLGLYEASIRGTRTRAVHAWTSSSSVAMPGPGILAPVDVASIRRAAEELLDTTLEAVAGDAAVRIERLVVESPAGPAIIGNAHDAELVVVGRRGLGTVRSLVLGSVSGYVVQHATCPVLVVPTPQ